MGEAQCCGRTPSITSSRREIREAKELEVGNRPRHATGLLWTTLPVGVGRTKGGSQDLWSLEYASCELSIMSAATRGAMAAWRESRGGGGRCGAGAWHRVCRVSPRQRARPSREGVRPCISIVTRMPGKCSGPILSRLDALFGLSGCHIGAPILGCLDMKKFECGLCGLLQFEKFRQTVHFRK